MNVLNDEKYIQFVKRYQQDLPAFCREVCGKSLSPDQLYLAQRVQRKNNSSVTTVSGTGTGKTNMIASIAMWKLLCFPVARYAGKVEVGSNIYIGAPVIKQVRDGAKKELAGLITYWKMTPHLRWIYEMLDVLDTIIRVRGFEEEWFITYISLGQSDSVAVAGKHRYNQMIIVDEAAGVPDGHFDVINGTQTQPNNKTLLFSQGVKTHGFFYESHTTLSEENGGKWDTVCMSSIDSPFVTDEWIDSVALQAGGVHEPEFKIRVLGQFADKDSNFLISRDDLQDIIGKSVITDEDMWGNILLVDVAAGEHRDSTVCAHARVVGNSDLGNDARRVDYVGFPINSSSIQLEETARVVADKYMSLSNCTVYVDADGIGLALVKSLENMGIPVKRVKWGMPCFKKEYKDRYYNLRACAMVRFRDAVRQGRVGLPAAISKADKQAFLNQGSKISYGFSESGGFKYKITSKEEMRRQGIKSPDLIDAMSFAFLEGAFYNVSEQAVGLEPSGEVSRFDILQQAGDIFSDF